jgi:ornithine cyclodeaminase/alanine dehydrogenase-like protein (mu-crystallin family)
MAKERFNRIPNNIIVADLTGIATQDMLISELVLSELNK